MHNAFPSPELFQSLPPAKHGIACCYAGQLSWVRTWLPRRADPIARNACRRAMRNARAYKILMHSAG
jgi:hypothetical protein